MSRSSDSSNIGCSILVLVAVALLFGIPSLIIGLHVERGQTFTITGKESVKDGKSGTYLVFTDKTTLKVDDTILKWRFDSSDVYGRLVIGKTYTADLQGYRVPFFSMYQNILNPVEMTAEK